MTYGDNGTDDNQPTTYNMFATEELAPVQGDYSIFDTEPTVDSRDRLARLEKTKSKILDNLNQEASLEDSYTDMGNGRLESNSNKIWNDLSDTEVQSLYQNVMSKELTKGEDGKLRYSDGTEYEGTARYAYLGKTKDRYSDAVKFGLARADRTSAAARYDHELGGYESGVKGIDASNLEQDVLLPYGAATMLEAVLHGRKKALEGRLVKDIYSNPNAKAAYGSGVSEYYTSKEALFGKPTETDKNVGAKLFSEYMQKVPLSKQEFRGPTTGLEYLLGDDSNVDPSSDSSNRIRAAVAAYKDDQGITLHGAVGSLGNAVSGFASSFVNELAVKPLDALGDATGLYDLDTNGDTIANVEDFFGYDTNAVEATMTKVGKHWDVASDSNASVLDRGKAAAKGMLEVFTTPEMLGTSLGVMAAWMAPGSVVKAFTKGSSYLGKVAAIDSAVKANKISKVEGIKRKTKEFMSVDGAKDFLISQSGYITSSLGNVNKQYEEFVANNNGVQLEGTDKASHIAGTFAVQLLNQNVDKLIDFKVMKSPGVAKALIPAVVSMTNKEFSKVATTMGKGILKTAENMGMEATQEYTQTMMELFNSRYGSEKFSDADTFAKFITDPRNTHEAGIAALAGAGGSGQFEVVGAAGDAFSNVAVGIGAVDTSDVPESETEVANVKQTASNLTTFASDNEKSNPIASSYAAQVSDNIDVKKKANVYAANARQSLVDGSNEVFSSDKPTPIDKIAELIELAAINAPEENYNELKNTIIKNMAAKGETVSNEDIAKLDAADTSGIAFAKLKSMSEVAEEVSTGTKGYLTYYAAAKAAEQVGDVKAQATNENKLEKFFQYEKEKSLRLQTKIAEVEAIVMAEAEHLITLGKAPNITEALRIKGEEYGKPTTKDRGKVTTVANSGKLGAKTTTIPHYDVALKLRAPEYNRGVYGLLTKVKSEVVVMYTISSNIHSKAVKSEAERVRNVNVEEAQLQVDDLNEALAESEASTSRLYPDDVQSWLAANVDNELTGGWVRQRLAALNNKEGVSDINREKVAKLVRNRIKKEAPVVKEVVEQKEPEVGDINSLLEAASFDGTEEDDFSFSNLSLDEIISSDDDVSGSLSDDQTDSYVPSVVNDPDVLTEQGTDDLGTLLSAADFDSTVDEQSYSFTDDQENVGLTDEQLTSYNESFANFTDEEESFNIDDYTEYEKSFAGNNNKKKKVKEAKLPEVERLSNLKIGILDITKEVEARKDQLRNDKTHKKGDTDTLLVELEAKRDELKEGLSSFRSSIKEHIQNRMDLLKNHLNRKVKMFTQYIGNVGTAQEYTLGEVFGNVKPTGFTVQKATADNVQKATMEYAERLSKTIIKSSAAHFDGVVSSVSGFLLYDVDGEINYNTAEVMHSAVNDYILRNNENLFGADRDGEAVAEILGIDEQDVTDGDMEALAYGGVTLRLSSADIGRTILKNLGIKPDNTAVANALATHLGISAWQGYADKNGQGIRSTVLSRTANGESLGSIDIIYSDDQILDKIEGIRNVNRSIEERLKVEVTSVKSYRTARKDKPRKATLRHAEFLNAPKEHTDTINRLENTPFIFNSGNKVLAILFSKDGKLDKEALMDKILGDKDSDRNRDDMESYKAQRLALTHSLNDYTNAMGDVGNEKMFFDWFVAKNHRMHLDSGTINPQGDKQIARWLITAAGTSVDLNKDLIMDVVEGRFTEDYSPETMVAKTFAYSIIQAFDGAKGVPGIDKEEEHIVLASANELLNNYGIDTLFDMAKEVDHIGHAALAIANIEKFREKSKEGTFTSDMVIEVDGLTNGFAFRAMQYPVGGEESMKEWLERVGVISVNTSNEGSMSGKPLSELESMNAAKAAGVSDVYISTGLTFGVKVRSAKLAIKKSADKLTNAVKRKDAKDIDTAKTAETSMGWINLFESRKALPDFSAALDDTTEESRGLLKFIRNLMKSPTMIFGYAAGLEKIASGLVRDQVLGKQYLKGKGLVTYLTTKDPKTKEFNITKEELVIIFGKDKAEVYQKARVALKTEKIDSVTNINVVTLRKDLTAAISELYVDPIKDTLTELFEEQTKVNAVLIQAGEFLYRNFKLEYINHVRENPNIDEDGKVEWLKTYTTLIPGVAGASSTDQKTKLMFLKNVLDKTNQDVRMDVLTDTGTKNLSSNTVSRGYGSPGVGPAVLTILSLDSSTLSEAINEFYKANDYADVVPVHDAIVLGVKDYGLISGYNEKFYSISKRYSIVEEFQKAISAMAVRYQHDAVRLESFTIKAVGKREAVTFGYMQFNLNSTLHNVKAARDKLFSQDLHVMQMGGPSGTMYKTDVKKAKEEAIKYIQNLASTIGGIMDNKELRKALGKKYKTHKKLIDDMLEGCS